MLGQSTAATKPAVSEGSNLFSITKGIIVSYIITIPAFIVFALVLSYTDFPEKYLPAVVLITTIMSIFVAGSTTTKHIKSRGWLNGGAVGLVYILVLYVLSSIVYKDFTINRQIISMALIGLLTGSIGGIVGINMRSSSQARQKRVRAK